MVVEGVVLTPLDYSGCCAPLWVLVMAVCVVGLWVTGAMLLCAVPGPLGLVYDGHGGAGGALPLVGVVVAAWHCGHWWWQCAWLGIGQSVPHSCVQRQGLWAWQTVVMGGAGGALRLLSWSHTIKAVGGWWHVSIGQCHVLVHNAWAFRPSGQRRGVGATGGPQSLSSSRHPVVVAIGGSQPGQSM